MLETSTQNTDIATFDARVEVYVDLGSHAADFDVAQRAVDYIGCFTKKNLRSLHVPRIKDACHILKIGFPGAPVVAVEHYTTASSWVDGDLADELRPRSVVVVRTSWLGDMMVDRMTDDGWEWVPAAAVAW